jgi:hypothetical protein
MNRTTTAQYRVQAAQAEKALDWGRAVCLWNEAIEAYPGRGALADRDKLAMAAKRDACRKMIARTPTAPGAEHY